MAAADLNICGFETGDTHECAQASGTFSIQSSKKRTGTYPLRTNPTGTATGAVIIWGRDSNGQVNDYDHATVYHRFYFLYLTKPAANDEIIFIAAAGTNVKFELRLNSSGQLVAYDSSASLLATGTTLLASDTWYRIEVKAGTGASAAYEVKLAVGDGSAALELSGTGDLGASNNTRSYYGKQIDRNGQDVDFYYDDIAVSSADYPGAGECHLVLPTADGTFTAWTIGAGSGSKFEQVDEVPYDEDMTYLLSTLVTDDAHTGLFDAEATLPSGVTWVNAVKTIQVCKRDTNNSLTRLRLRSGVTNSDTGSDVLIGSTYQLIKVEQLHTTDPNTPAAWDTSDMSALEAGVIERDTLNRTRVTAIFMMVDVTLPPSFELSAGATLALVSALSRGVALDRLALTKGKR